MERVSFWQTVSYGHPDNPTYQLTTSQKFFRASEQFFYWGGRRAYVVPGKKLSNGGYEVEIRDPRVKQSAFDTLCKVVALFSLIVPAIFLLGKCLHRRKYAFYTFPPTEVLLPTQQAPARSREKMAAIHAAVTEKREEPVAAGYGVYLPFRKNSAGERKVLSQELYERVNALFHAFPIHLHSWSTGEYSASMTERIHDIDPSVELTFVPQSLYNFLCRREEEESPYNTYLGIEKELPGKACALSLKEWYSVADKQIPSPWKEIVRNTLDVECSPMAKTHALFYRWTSDIRKDRPYVLGQVQSLSYDKSLSPTKGEAPKGELYVVPILYADLPESPMALDGDQATTKIWNMGDLASEVTLEGSEPVMNCEAETYFKIFEKYNKKAIMVSPTKEKPRRGSS